MASEHKRRELLLQLQHTVTRRLAELPDANEGVRGALQAICETESWDHGKLWRLDTAAGVMRRHVAWVRPGIEGAQQYAEASRELVFAAGEGLVGTVWQTREPLWTPDTTANPRARRRRLAERTGLRAAFHCPVIYGGNVVGVLAFVC